MPKCDFNTSARVLSCEFAAYFPTPFSQNTCEGLLCLNPSPAYQRKIRGKSEAYSELSQTCKNKSTMTINLLSLLKKLNDSKACPFSSGEKIFDLRYSVCYSTALLQIIVSSKISIQNSLLLQITFFLAEKKTTSRQHFCLIKPKLFILNAFSTSHAELTFLREKGQFLGIDKFVDKFI